MKTKEYGGKELFVGLGIYYFGKRTMQCWYCQNVTCWRRYFLHEKKLRVRAVEEMKEKTHSTAYPLEK